MPKASRSLGRPAAPGLHAQDEELRQVGLIAVLCRMHQALVDLLWGVDHAGLGGRLGRGRCWSRGLWRGSRWRGAPAVRRRLPLRAQPTLDPQSAGGDINCVVAWLPHWLEGVGQR